MSQDWLLASAEELAARIPDGAKVAIGVDNTGAAAGRAPSARDTSTTSCPT